MNPIQPRLTSRPPEGPNPRTMLIEPYPHDAIHSTRGLSLMLWITAVELILVAVSVWFWWRS